MLWSVQDIEDGSSITIRYTKDESYFNGQCKCVSCSPDNPPMVIRRPIETQEAGSGVGESSTAKRKKPHRAGRRKRKVRRTEEEDLSRKLDRLDQLH